MMATTFPAEAEVVSGGGVFGFSCCGMTPNLSRSHQAMRYMQLIPECQRPVSGTDGALQRRRKLLIQLPVYDQDPMKCQSLASEEEVHCY